MAKLWGLSKELPPLWFVYSKYWLLFIKLTLLGIYAGRYWIMLFPILFIITGGLFRYCWFVALSVKGVLCFINCWTGMLLGICWGRWFLWLVGRFRIGWFAYGFYCFPDAINPCILSIGNKLFSPYSLKATR